MDYPTEGGSYTRNPKTGELTLVHRTEGDAVRTEAAAQAVPPVEPVPAANPTTTKPEKA